jgi:hypothetical protein
MTVTERHLRSPEGICACDTFPGDQMNETLRRDLTSALRGWLVRERTEAEQAAFQTWKDQRAAGTPVNYLPSSLAMDVSHVLIVSETLLVIFDWPEAPGRHFAYAEELEDLSELDVEGWGATLIAHIDETIGPGFGEQYSLVQIGDLEVLVQNLGPVATGRP